MSRPHARHEGSNALGLPSRHLTGRPSLDAQAPSHPLRSAYPLAIATGGPRPRVALRAPYRTSLAGRPKPRTPPLGRPASPTGVGPSLDRGALPSPKAKAATPCQEGLSTPHGRPLPSPAVQAMGLGRRPEPAHHHGVTVGSELNPTPARRRGVICCSPRGRRHSMARRQPDARA